MQVVAESAIPEPGPGEVRIKVLARRSPFCVWLEREKTARQRRCALLAERLRLQDRGLKFFQGIARRSFARG
jgi:hypothetical protein